MNKFTNVLIWVVLAVPAALGIAFIAAIGFVAWPIIAGISVILAFMYLIDVLEQQRGSDDLLGVISTVGIVGLGVIVAAGTLWWMFWALPEQIIPEVTRFLTPLFSSGGM